MERAEQLMGVDDVGARCFAPRFCRYPMSSRLATTE